MRDQSQGFAVCHLAISSAQQSEYKHCWQGRGLSLYIMAAVSHLCTEGPVRLELRPLSSVRTWDAQVELCRGYLLASGATIHPAPCGCLPPGLLWMSVASLIAVMKYQAKATEG